MVDLSPEARALLDTIAGPESAGAYDVIYGGSTFNNYSDHPRQAVRISSGPNAGQTSSAAGRYQFLGSTWDDIAGRYGLNDFSPANQDLGAWALAQEEYQRDTGRSLQADLAAGDLSRVPGSLRNQWTSMPGGIEQGITGNAFSAAYWRNMGLNPNAAPPDLNAINMAIPGALGTPQTVGTASRRPQALLPPIGQSGGPGVGTVMRPANGATQPRRQGILGAIGTGLGNLANMAGQQAAPIMRAAGDLGQGIMRAANPLGTVAGRTAVIDTMLARAMNGSNRQPGPQDGQRIMIPGAGMQIIGQRLNNSPSGLTVSNSTWFNSVRGLGNASSSGSGGGPDSLSPTSGGGGPRSLNSHNRPGR